VLVLYRRGVAHYYLGDIVHACKDYNTCQSLLRALTASQVEQLQDPTPSVPPPTRPYVHSLVFHTKALTAQIALLKSAQALIDTGHDKTLKKQADQLLALHKYHESIAKYNSVIDISPCTAVSMKCVCNRALACLCVSLYEQCVRDCSVALMLLGDREWYERANNQCEEADGKDSQHTTTTRSDLHEMARIRLTVKLLVRRGTAHMYMKRLVAAKRDYGTALRLHASMGDDCNVKVHDALKHDFNELTKAVRIRKLMLKAGNAYAANKFDAALKGLLFILCRMHVYVCAIQHCT